MYHVGRGRRAGGAVDAIGILMSDATMDWNPNHTHPQGSWWQYRNDERIGPLMIVALGAMAVIIVALITWAVMTA